MKFVITTKDVLLFVFIAFWLVMFIIGTVAIVIEDVKNKLKKWRKKHGKRVSK